MLRQRDDFQLPVGLRRPSTNGSHPGLAFKGTGRGGINRVLNKHLLAKPHFNLRPCGNFTVGELQDLTRVLYDAMDPVLVEMYAAADDPRLQDYEDEHELAADQREHALMLDLDGGLHDSLRDQMCYTAVMWLIHHLTAESQVSPHPSCPASRPTNTPLLHTLRQVELGQTGIGLPLLPVVNDDEPGSQRASGPARRLRRVSEYTVQRTLLSMLEQVPDRCLRVAVASRLLRFAWQSDWPISWRRI